MKTPPLFYASPCPDTGRWFVRQTGRDDIIAETFNHEGRTAHENAMLIADMLNAATLAANLAGLHTGNGAQFDWPHWSRGGNGTEPDFRTIQAYFTTAAGRLA